jgi:uncharacterized RDD family membrane protein YckC
MNTDELEYVGFWARVGAALIDSVLIIIVITPIMHFAYGSDYSADGLLRGASIKGPVDLIVSWILPAVAVIWFWVARQATPGKMVIAARIVDASTGQPATTGQLIGRYFAYYVSIIPFMLGLIWVGIDPRKQGWHDKLANTVVVRAKNRGVRPVVFWAQRK